MEKIDFLLEVASFLNLKDVVYELERIKKCSSQENVELIFPLVGEFSAGKTSLINALTDNRKLEVATKPTTATIYKIHFGCDSCHANVLKTDGAVEEYEDIAKLKNDELENATIVDVFDTSTRIPSTTILVDTPGLSSSTATHKKILMDFLPYADGILLIVDVNSQITRSLTDFIEMMKLSKRPIYLIITKCDTKSTSELEKTKLYISDNIQLPLKRIACVSAVNDNLDELFQLFESVQKDKTDILKQVNAQRIKNISDTLFQCIDELLQASSSDRELDEAVRKQEYELSRISRNIDRLVESTQEDINESSKQLCRQFEDIISEKLEALVVGKSQNFDADAVSLINNTSCLLMNDFRRAIQNALCEKAKQQQKTDNSIPLHSLKEIDLSSLSISGISYNIDLNSIGHQYDIWIANGVKVVAAAAAVAAVAYAGGAAVAAKAVTAGSAVDIADTVSDVGSIISNNKMVNRIKKVADEVSRVSDKFNSIEMYNQQTGQQMGCSKGLVESMVGFITDKNFGKPQRKRAIRQYMEEILMPEFKQAMLRVEQQLVSSIQTALCNEANQTIQEKTEVLEQLKMERKDKKDDYEKRMSQLRDYKSQLLVLSI